MVTKKAYYVTIDGVEYSDVRLGRCTKARGANRLGTFNLEISDASGTTYSAIDNGSIVLVYRSSDDYLIFGGYINNISRDKRRKRILSIAGTDFTGVLRQLLIDAQIYEGNEESVVIRDIMHNYVLSTTIVDDMNATTGWVAAGDLSALAFDTTNERIGTGCLSATATYSSGTGTLTKTISSGLTIATTDQLVVYLYRSASTVLGTSIRLNFGQDSSNYWTVTKAVSGIDFTSGSGWQYVIFDVSTKTTGAGSPSLSAVDYYQVSFDIASGASGTIKADDLRRVPNTSSDITLDNVSTGTNTVGYLQLFNIYVFDIFNKLGKQFMHDFYIDKSKVLNYGTFGSTSSGLTFTRGDNIIASNFRDTPERKVTDLTVHGNRQLYVQPAQLFSGDGSNATFTLTVEPVSVEVSVGGTVKTGYTPSGSGSFDYTLKAQSMQVVFETASIPGAGVNNVSIVPTIGVPIIVQGDTGETNIFKIFEAKTENTYIDKVDDAQSLVGNELLIHGDDAQIGQLVSTIQPTLEPGTTIDVVDTVSFSATQTFTAKQVEHQFIGSRLTTTIQTQEVPLSPGDYVTNLLNRLAAIENKEKTISDRVRKLQRLRDDLALTDVPSSNLVISLSYGNDSFLLSDANNSLLNAAAEAFTLSGFETLAEWVQEPTNSIAVTLTNDSTSGHYWIGSQGINMAWVGTSGLAITQNTVSQPTLATVTGTASGTPSRGTIGVWCYTTTASSISAVSLLIGNDSSNYYAYAGKQYAYAVAGTASSFALVNNGLTLVLFDLNVPIVSIGTVNWATIDYTNLAATVTAAGNITFDYLTANKNNVISQNGLGARQTTYSTNAVTGASS